MHFLLWSAFLKGTILLSPLNRYSLLLVGALTPHSRLPLASCRFSLPCWGSHRPGHPRLKVPLPGCPLPYLKWTPSSAGLCSDTPRPLPLFSDAPLTGLWHTFLGHWMWPCCSQTPTAMAESPAKYAHSPYSLDSDTSHWAATPCRHHSAWALTPHTRPPPEENPPWAVSHVVHLPQPIQALTPGAWQLSYSPSPSFLAPAPGIGARGGGLYLVTYNRIVQ